MLADEAQQRTPQDSAPSESFLGLDPGAVAGLVPGVDWPKALVNLKAALGLSWRQLASRLEVGEDQISRATTWSSTSRVRIGGSYFGAGDRRGTR